MYLANVDWVSSDGACNLLMIKCDLLSRNRLGRLFRDHWTRTCVRLECQSVEVEHYGKRRRIDFPGEGKVSLVCVFFLMYVGEHQVDPKSSHSAQATL